MRRLVLAILVGLLSLSASGAASLLVDEPCSAFELAGQGQDDGTCPPTCVTCGCCAQAAEPVTITVANSPRGPLIEHAAALPHVPDAEPADILHVPKLALA